MRVLSSGDQLRAVAESITLNANERLSCGSNSPLYKGTFYTMASYPQRAINLMLLSLKIQGYKNH
jgi:hypothetical protein